MTAYTRVEAKGVTVGTRAYPRGVVTEVATDAPLKGWTTLHVQGRDRYDLQAVHVEQYSPRRSFRERSAD